MTDIALDSGTSTYCASEHRACPTRVQLEAIYPEVFSFAEQMAKELWVNRNDPDAQPNWKHRPILDHVRELHYHTAKLLIALKHNNRVKVREYTADIADYAMMIADVMGLLET